MSNLSINQLMATVRDSKSPSSARSYLAMLKRLRDYSKSDVIEPNVINSTWVDGFATYLCQCGLRQSSVNQFLLLLRAVVTDAIDDSQRIIIKEAFGATSYHKTVDASVIDISDLALIIDGNPVPNNFLQKIREKFIEHLTDGTDHSAEDDRWPVALHCLGEALQLRHRLDTHSLQHARQMLSNALDSRAESLVKKLRSLERERWYAIRCHRFTPTEIYSKNFTGQVKNFIPSISWKRNLNAATMAGGGTKRPEKFPALIDKLLFVYTYPHDIIEKKRSLYPDANVYSTPGTGTPSPISDREMRVFMFLCDNARDITINEAVEDSKIKAEDYLGHEVVITAGDFSGIMGIIDKVDPQHYLVQVKFPTIGGALVTATVPIDIVEEIREEI